MTQRQLIGGTVTVVAVILLAGVMIWFVREIAEILVLLLVSAVLATACAPLVGFVERWRIVGRFRLPRGAAIGALYLAIFIVVVLISAMVIAPAVGETRRFVQQAPSLLTEGRQWLAGVRVQRPWVPDLASDLDHLSAQGSNAAMLGSGAAVLALRLAGGLVAAITVLVVTFYMLLEGASIKSAFLTVFPQEERPRVSLLLHRIGMKFGGWLRGQLLLAVSVAVPVSLVLLAIGIPYPFLIGVIAGVGELIPLVGLTLAAVIAVLVTLGQPAWQLLAVVIFFVVAMNLESHILIPRLMARVLGLSPLLTIVALLIGVKLLGLLGGLLALPVAAAVQVMAREVVQEINSPVRPLVSAAPIEDIAKPLRATSAWRAGPAEFPKVS
ncbi:MAG TPA: AI-2E family transporter [bacterium]|nr:AI-2E family transporter [bacterium]